MAKKKLYTKPLAVMVREETHKKLMEICDKHELSFSEWIREAIEHKLDNENEKNTSK